MSESAAVYEQVKGLQHITFPVLVPNVRGLEEALRVGVKEIAVFGAASETFSMKNINCDIETSFRRFEEVIAMAKQHHLWVRG